MRRWLPVLWVASMGAPILAGTIEVKVVGPGGGGIAGASVVLDHLSAPAFLLQGGGIRRVWTTTADSRSATTGPDGECRFQDVPAGSWFVRAEAPTATLLVPQSDSVPVTLLRDDAAAVAAVTMLRGDLVRVRAADGGADITGYEVLFWSETGGRRGTTIGGARSGAAVLEPGRWLPVTPMVRLPGGSTFEVDGVTLDAANPLVTRGEGRTFDVRWRLEATERAEGKVTFVGPRIPGALTAVASPLDDSGESQGESPDVRVAPVRADDRFVLPLRPGRWRISLVGDDDLESTPEYRDVEVGTGAVVAVAFSARRGERVQRRGTRLVVQVQTPEGEPCAGASVFARRLQEGLPRDAAIGMRPLGEGRFEVSLEDPGLYRIDASHDAWVGNSVAVSNDDPQRRPTLEATVRLRRGASIAVRTARGTEAPPAEIRASPVGPAREDAGPAPSDAGTRRVDADAKGEALLRGMEARRWRVEAARGDASAWRYLVRIGDAPPAPSVELDLAEGDVGEVEVVPEAAAAVSARLQCEDGTPVPGSAAFSAYPADRPDAAPVFVGGSRHATGATPITYGPIPPGRWRFEFEPWTFARTTWAPGTEIPADAETYVLEADGVPKDLGTIRVDCAPAAQLAVFIDPRGADPGNVPSPDLRLARLDGRFRENDDAPWQPLKGLSVAASKDAIYVHKLPEGEGTLEITIRHPHLLDEPFAVATLRGKRYRGGLHQAVAEARGVGGAIVYSGAKRLKLLPRADGVALTPAPTSGSGGFAVKAAAATPVPEDLAPRIVPIDPDWGAAVSVAPGVYDVHACGEPDPECERVEKLWSGIRVQAGSTVELR
jgi:hypothetical protein